MSNDIARPSTSPLRNMGVALGVLGVIAVIVGLLILLWPGQSAKAIVAIIAAYAVVAGVAYILLGLLSKTRGTWQRVGNALLGVLFIAAAVIAFANLGAAAVVLAALVGVVIGIVWIIEGAVALIAVGRSVQGESQTWAVVFAVISILAGIVLIFTPVFAALIWWLFLGVSLVIQGIVQIVRAVQIVRGRR